MFRLLITLLVSGFAITGLTLGTLAAFSDTETSSNNTLEAGTLNITLTDPSPAAFDNIKPGDSGSWEWTIESGGSIGGTLSLASTVTTAENGVEDAEASATTPVNDVGSDGDLDEYVCINADSGIGTDAADAIASFGDVYDGDLEGLKAALDAESEVLSALNVGDDTYVLNVAWSVETEIAAGDPCSSGAAGAVDENVIQTDTGDIDIDFDFAQ